VGVLNIYYRQKLMLIIMMLQNNHLSSVYYGESIFAVCLRIYRVNGECFISARRYNLVGVTRRKHRTVSWYFSQKALSAAKGHVEDPD